MGLMSKFIRRRAEVRYFNGEEGLEDRVKSLILKDKVLTAG